MKKCRQCGILSADTATVCRHCNAKFSEDDKPIVVKAKKNKSIIFTVITVVVAIIAVTIFVLYQTGIIRMWTQTSDRNKITVLAEEFVKADFEKDTQKIKGYMFDKYIEFHEKQGTFSLQEGNYTSFYFSMYNPNVSIKVSSVNINFLEDEFQIYYSVINKKYDIDPNEIVCVEVHVQITDNDIVTSTMAPITFVKLDNKWFIVPVI